MSTRKRDDSIVLAISGGISSSDAIELSRKLELFAGKRWNTVVLDLSALEFVDSHWLGVFVYCWKLYNEKGKRLIFSVPPGYVRKIFMDARLDKTFTIVDSVDAC